MTSDTFSVNNGHAVDTANNMMDLIKMNERTEQAREIFQK